MAYVEKASAKAGTQLALQVGFVCLKAFLVEKGKLCITNSCLTQVFRESKDDVILYVLRATMLKL